MLVARQAQALELMCRCDDIPDDGIELRVLKGLLTAVTSNAMHVHGQALLLVRPACLHPGPPTTRGCQGAARFPVGRTIRDELCQILARTPHCREWRTGSRSMKGGQWSEGRPAACSGGPAACWPQVGSLAGHQSLITASPYLQHAAALGATCFVRMAFGGGAGGENVLQHFPAVQVGGEPDDGQGEPDADGECGVPAHGAPQRDRHYCAHRRDGCAGTSPRGIILYLHVRPDLPAGGAQSLLPEVPLSTLQIECMRAPGEGAGAVQRFLICSGSRLLAQHCWSTWKTRHLRARKCRDGWRPPSQVVSAVDPFGSYASEIEAGLNDAFVHDTFQHAGSAEGLQPGTPLPGAPRGAPPIAGVSSPAPAPADRPAVAAEAVPPELLVGGNAARTDTATAEPAGDSASPVEPAADSAAERPAAAATDGAAAGAENEDAAAAPATNGDGSGGGKPPLQVRSSALMRGCLLYLLAFTYIHIHSQSAARHHLNVGPLPAHVVRRQVALMFVLSSSIAVPVQTSVLARGPTKVRSCTGPSGGNIQLSCGGAERGGRSRGRAPGPPRRHSQHGQGGSAGQRAAEGRLPGVPGAVQAVHQDG